MLLGMLQTGGVILEQAMERVTDSSPLSLLLVAGTFTLSLVYLLRLAAGRGPPLPAGAVRAPVSSLSLSLSLSFPALPPPRLAWDRRVWCDEGCVCRMVVLWLRQTV